MRRSANGAQEPAPTNTTERPEDKKYPSKLLVAYGIAAHPDDVRRRHRSAADRRRCGRTVARRARPAGHGWTVHQRRGHPAADPGTRPGRRETADRAGYLVRERVDDGGHRQRGRPAAGVRLDHRRRPDRSGAVVVLRATGPAVPAGGHRLDHHRHRAIPATGGVHLGDGRRRVARPSGPIGQHRPGRTHPADHPGDQSAVLRRVVPAVDPAGHRHRYGGRGSPRDGRLRQGRQRTGVLAAADPARSARRPSTSPPLSR